jgi:hypothetical protein
VGDDADLAMTQARGLLGFAAACGAAAALSGCPGALDQSLLDLSQGSGGDSGSGSGGNTSTGGSTGSGGSAAACTGTNDINYIMAGTGDPSCPGLACNACAQSGCHASGPQSAGLSGGLDLTLDANIGSRLVGTSSGTAANGSSCVGHGNYLNSTNPPTGLLIDKIKPNQPCGLRMPSPGVSPLSSTQISCVEAWAEGLIMAAQ